MVNSFRVYLGLVLACLWVIFRRTSAPWRTAWRMLEVFVVVLIVSSIIASFLPTRFRDLTELMVALSSLIAAVLTGFQQAKRYPKIQMRTPT